MRNYTAQDQDDIPANVPFRHYLPSDHIELVGVRKPTSMREAIPFINVPGPGQTWQELNQWREAYGLRPVTR